jgi:hypothetical protein
MNLVERELTDQANNGKAETVRVVEAMNSTNRKSTYAIPDI